MAGGNLGDLWFNLGIRENVSEEMNRILKAIQKSDGSVSSLTRKLNELLQSMDEKSADKFSKGLEKGIQNGLKYLGMLQQVEQEMEKIRGLKASNKGVNVSGLETAMQQLRQFKGDLLDLQKAKAFGGVDNAALGRYSGTLKNILADVKNLERSFDKENSLSAAKNNAARLTNELERVKNKLAEIYSMQSSGMKGGFDTRYLLSAGNSLRGIQRRISSMLGNDDLLLNESKYKSLISDIQFAFTKAAGSIQEYNREKAKANELNREVKAYDKSVEKQAQADAKALSDYAKRYMQLQEERRRAEERAKREGIAAEKQRQAEIERTRTRIQSLSHALQNLWSKRQAGRALGLDTSKADEGIRRTIFKLRILKNLLLGLYNGNWTKYLGNLGNMGNGREVSAVNHLASEQAKVNAEKQKAVQLEEKHRQEVTATAARVRSDLVSAFEQARKSASGVNSTVQDLKNLFLQGGLVYGAQQFANSIIQTGGEMEKQHIALQSILGDMQNADIMFGNVKELALKSPFTFSELNRDVKQLAAYGVEYEQLYDTTKRLADISAGLGVSFERIALAFGQVRARGWLDGKELRQISYAGIPILSKLSEYYSKKEGQKVSTSDVKKRISNREVDFSDVKQIFWDMTDAGGQFYNMQEVLSETLLGRYNKLKDAWEIMLADFARGGSMVGGTFKTIIDLVTTLVQNINTIGPALMAVFGTVAMRKGLTALGGNAGASLRSAKASVAADIQKRLVLGQQVSQTELRILATKRQITSEDIKALATARALTRNDLERLLLQGKITKEMYAQNIGGVAQMSRMGTMRRVVALQQGGGFFNKMRADLLKLNLATSAYFTKLKIQMASSGTLWSSFAVKGLSAFTLLGSGIKALGATMWAAIGGLPGMLITAVTMGVGYMINANAELRQALDQSQDELENRKKQINEFLRDQDANKAINSGDKKEIDNMIDEYEDKLKELSPSMSGFFIMNANEKQSHEERLKYLHDEMEAMKKANIVAQMKLSDEDNFSSLKDYFEKSQKLLNEVFVLKGKAQAYNATDIDKQAYVNASVHYEEYAREISRKFAEILPDVGNNPESQRAVVQMFDNMLAQVNIPEEQANYMRASVMKALGIADGWLNEQVGTEMQKLIETSSSDIADKIRNNIELTDAEKSKVKELMQDAKKNLSAEYPHLAGELQRLLDTSNFQAIIKLVFSMQSPAGALENQVMKNLLGGGKMLLKDGSKYTGHAKRWIKGTEDPDEVVNRAHQDIDAARNSLVRWNKMLRVGKATQAEADKAEQAYRDMVNANYEAFGDWYLGQDKKSNKTPKGKTNKEDTVLKELKARIDLYKKFYEELQKFKKIYGSGALAKLRERGDFSPVFSYGLKNADDYSGSIKDLLSRVKSSTADRIDYKNKEIGGIADKDRQKEEQRIDDVNSALREKLNLLSEEYDTYKKLYELTGDRNSSMRLAFGGKVQSETMKEYLANEMKKALPEANKRSGQSRTADEVLAMSEADFKATYGEKSEKVSEIFYKYRDELKKVQKETIDLMTRLVQENATIDQQIADLDRKHERNVALINGDKNMSPEFKTRALAGEDKSYNDKRSSLRFEQFKQSTDWVKVFDDLDRVSNETIDEMIKGIDKFSKEGNLSVEVVKQLREALSKLRKENMERNPFDVLMNTTSQANAIGSFLRDKNNKTDKDGKYTVSEAQGKKMGLNAGKYTKADLEGEQRGKYSDFTKTIGVITQKFKALEAAMEPIATLFDNLGVGGSGLKDVFDAAGNALSAASNMSGAMDTLSQLTGDGTSGLSGMLAGAGPYAAAAAAGISMINSIAAKHDEALQKEIEASKGRQKEMENLSKNVQWEIDNILGGVYNFTSDKFKDKFQKVLDEYNSTNEFNKHFKKLPSLQQKNYSKGTADAVKESIANPDSAFAAQRAAFMVQRDELEKQLKAEEGKKKSSSSAIADYKQQIIELNQEIDAFTDEWAKKIYDIDLKSWAKEFTDVIVDAWAKGEDAVGAYKDKVKEMMNSLARNIIAQSVLEIAFKPVQKMLRDKLQNNEGKLKTTDIAEIGKELDTALGNSVDNVTGLLDELKKRGWDLSENGSLSVSNSIKGVTEETADLLASYINAIRLDVSVNRANIEQMVEAVKKIPNLTVIAQSQLTQLNTLVSLAQTRNEKLDMMYDWMKATTNGTKKISVA